MNFVSLKIRLISIISAILILIIFALITYGIIYGIGYSIDFLALLLILIPIFVVMDILQWLFGPYLIGRAYRAHEITPSDPEYLMLTGIVERVANNNHIKTPKVFIAEVDFPNAFAYGSPVAGKRMAVTRGLLNLLTPQEIEAVIGHEIGHLKHHDVEFLMAIGIIPTLLFYFGYLLLFSGSNNRRGGYLLIAALVAMAMSFLFRILLLGFNRLRESYADVNAALTVDNGAEYLQTGLAKIIASSRRTPWFRKQRNQNNSPSQGLTNMLMFSNIEDSFDGDYRSLLEKLKTMKPTLISYIFSDHPHPAKRIQLLERMKREINNVH